MKKIRLYIDTSVLGGLTDTEDKNRVDIAERLIKAIKDNIYEGFISFLTLEEILKAPYEIHNLLKSTIADSGFKVLEETEDCIDLANTYLNYKIIPNKYRDDARHIAMGVVHDCDYIVSWNYKHMVNITVRRLSNSVNLKMGYKSIEIISPEEVIGYGEVEI